MIDTKFLPVVRGLMLAENLGDVHDELDSLCDLVGLSRLEGNFLDGWTQRDWEMVGQTCPA